MNTFLLRRHTVLLGKFLVVILLIGIGSSNSAVAESTPSLAALPYQVLPGGELFVSGAGFSPGIDYTVGLSDDGDPIYNDWWVGVQTDRMGGFQTTVPIPPQATPGEYLASAGRTATAPEAFDHVLIAPGLTLTLNPQRGQPGTQVRFTVENLIAGELRLDYDGVPLLGPFAVAGGTYIGKFIVPGDRPLPLGGVVPVRVANLLHGGLVGSVEAEFTSQGLPVPPRYVFSQVDVPAGTFLAGDLVTITGQITPPPVGGPAGYQVMALWHAPSGAVFPIGNGASLIQANGSFSLPVRVPDLLGGDPLPAQAGSQLGLALITPGVGGAAEISVMDVPINLTVGVWALDGETGLPVPGVRVLVIDKTLNASDQMAAPQIK